MLKMKYRTGIYYSEEQKSLMWDHWQTGDSLHAIARLFDRGHSAIGRILSETGGIRPAQRSRSQLSLRMAEREEISRGIMARELFNWRHAEIDPMWMLQLNV
jgi:IS30 family transposase